MAKEYKDNSYVRTTTRAKEWKDPDRDTLPERMDVGDQPRDEMIPERGRRMERAEEHQTGEREDTAGSHGRMMPETAESLDKSARTSERKED